MKPTNQVLKLDPPTELFFRGPFTEVVTTTLRLNNDTDRRICFKLKANVPQLYCVHPSVAIVEPHDHVNVNVMLQPTTSEWPDADGSHKFLVQSIFAPDGTIDSLERLFKFVKPEDVMTSKLMCVFQQPKQGFVSQADILVCNGSSEQTKHEVVGSVKKSNDSRSTTGSVPLSVIVLLLALVVALLYKFLL